jgi:hypothetical protein
MVSGLAALLFSQNSNRTNDIVRNIIERATDDINPTGWDAETGYGRINAYNAFVGDLAGTVCVSRTSEPVAGATITFIQNGNIIASTETNLSGFYQISDLPNGFYDVEASASGYQTVNEEGIYISPAETNILNLTFEAFGSVSGNVYVRKRAISGVLIEAKQDGVVKALSTSNAEGNYVITDLPTQTYDLTASLDGYESQTKEGIVIEPGQTVSGIDFNMKKVPLGNKPKPHK